MSSQRIVLHETRTINLKPIRDVCFLQMVANYDEVMKLALERGFYFPSCEIYSDAPAGFWEYGPTGVNMKNKFIELWRRELVRRDGMLEIDGCQIMSKSVFIASGHIGNFTDPIVKCTKCGSTFRADRYITEKTGENVLERMAEEAISKGLTPNKIITYYLALLIEFYDKTGIDVKRSRFRNLSVDEKAFYASVAFDFEVETSIGWIELVACNYRSDYDLKGHAVTSKQNLEVVDPANQRKVLPHVFELSMGIDRSIYAILEHCYYEDKQHDDRVVLRLKPYLAPILVGILPLMAKDGLDQKARQINSELKYDFDTFYDESGSIGRRYRRLEEIGTPYAVTVDQTTMQDDTVTVRHRDTMQQERIKVSGLRQHLQNALDSR